MFGWYVICVTESADAVASRPLVDCSCALLNLSKAELFRSSLQKVTRDFFH